MISRPAEAAMGRPAARLPTEGAAGGRDDRSCFDGSTSSRRPPPG